MKTILIATLLVAASLILPVAHAEPSDADTKKLAALRTQAEKGDAEAFYDLGAALLVGNLGIAKDEVEAVKWLRKAAEQNLAEAQYNLGVCHLEGEGVPKDEMEAVKWFRKAAEQNYDQAQYNLGLCYAEGIGVTKDYVEAYKWWLLAAAAGQENSKSDMPQMESLMTQEQIAEGKRRADDWLEQRKIPSTNSQRSP